MQMELEWLYLVAGVVTAYELINLRANACGQLEK
jgi:hypothetical protein